MKILNRAYPLFSILSAIIGVGIMSGCNKSESHEHSSPADLVVYGNIYTADQSESTVKAFAVKDGKFVFVGNKDEAAWHSQNAPGIYVLPF